jgi:hypothetical protein
MKNRIERSSSAGMKVKSSVKAGLGSGTGYSAGNHNQTVRKG